MIVADGIEAAARPIERGGDCDRCVDAQITVDQIDGAVVASADVQEHGAIATCGFAAGEGDKAVGGERRVGEGKDHARRRRYREGGKARAVGGNGGCGQRVEVRDTRHVERASAGNRAVAFKGEALRRGGVVDGDGGAVTVADGDAVRCGGDDGAGPFCCVMPTAAATVSVACGGVRGGQA